MDRQTAAVANDLDFAAGSNHNIFSFNKLGMGAVQVDVRALEGVAVSLRNGCIRVFSIREEGLTIMLCPAFICSARQAEPRRRSIVRVVNRRFSRTACSTTERLLAFQMS
ncbi:hypothetical protein [Paenibacillus sp. CAA11]|uniref:hypothetical protein n=1 Tax=Paenibacillus sp. CAA11 TaxID=1532905 RepID=UPI001F2B2D1E|nr:hypothetical protein [Paenibacillus sp. CAA11]